MSRVSDIGEFALIDRVSRFLPVSDAVVEGVGDDCAVLRVGDRLQLVSCDLFIEDVHFKRDHATPEDIGWKAAMAALSDIAAMGGRPDFILVSLACPPDTEVAFIEALYEGLGQAARVCRASVVGGDTTRAPQGIILDVMVIGEAVNGNYRTRTGAQPGDLLAVTGHLGLSAAGCHALRNGHEAPALIKAHYCIGARTAEGQVLADNNCVHSMIDVTDGLAQDAGHLAQAAAPGVNLHTKGLRIDEPLASYCRQHQLDPLDFILGGGEDYELAFSIQADAAKPLVEDLRGDFGLPAAIIGEFTDEWRGVRIDGREGDARGYDHFRSLRKG